MKDLNKHTRALADSLKAAMTIGDNGATTTAEGWYATSLPETVTIDQVKTIQEHNSAVTAALPIALAELGMPVLKANPALAQLTASVAAGHDTISADIVREYQHGKSTINGHVISAHTVNAAGPYRGELALAVKHVRAMADDLLTGGAK